MASRILSQDEARARRGPMEGQCLRPGSSEQRSSCGRSRSQHDRSHRIVPAGRNDSVGRKGMASRILSQDEARARRGPMEARNE